MEGEQSGMEEVCDQVETFEEPLLGLRFHLHHLELPTNKASARGPGLEA